MSVRDQIVEKLSVKFAPTYLEVLDESSKHHGHAGWREGVETHFRVRIASEQLVGQTRLSQHRAIMEALKAELIDPVHALAIEVLPAEGAFSPPNKI
jgi:BolA family transcriptional regulator, general stress-responsive regulator